MNGIEKDIADFYITLAMSMAGLFIITGAFVIFQYQNISMQATQTYDLFRKYLNNSFGDKHFLEVLINSDKFVFCGGWRGLGVSERTVPAHLGESGKPISIQLLAPNPPKEHRNIKIEPGPDG